MIHRRRFLSTGCIAMAGVLPATRCATAIASGFQTIGKAEGRSEEDLPAFVRRVSGKWDESLYRQMLGSANEFKEGDAIVGVAAADDAVRQLARELLGRTTLKQIYELAPQKDDLFRLLQRSLNPELQQQLSTMTLSQLKSFLLEKPEQQIHSIRDGLSSDVIACVVRLMTNDELIQLGAKVFNPLPGTNIGTRGYMGARVQPNSPTDNIDDIRWQVLNAFSYAVGDVLLGTNPVSSDPESVAAIEQTLQDILVTFDITDAMPHCVLAHIDVQAEVERLYPGSTAFWFQSIAGNDSANATFDISVEKMVKHAAARNGRYGLYFETGQGADFTNGHGYGVDMVTYESRKYGFARALTQTVAQALTKAGSPPEPWVHLNDVAGFIGPEVFRTKEQLVRCCLEDIAMGKLHGLTIGLDICSTLHMDVSLDDLEWCIDQIMPANPGYLMALPTRIDPMLGYLTTGYQDHVRVREKFGYKVNDRMWQFFQNLGVIDASGQPTEHFGDPGWVYLKFCRAKQDSRTDSQILQEASTKVAEIRGRGVFIAERFGDMPSQLAPELDQHIHRIYDEARKCIWLELTDSFVNTLPEVLRIRTKSLDRMDYILHPVSGEHLSEASILKLKQLRDSTTDDINVQLVVSDGLNANAVMDADQLESLLRRLRFELDTSGFRVASSHIVVDAGRVRAGYRIGEQLFGGRAGRRALLHVIGERPGSGHNTLSVYMTCTDGRTWGTPDAVDHNITRVVSGIAITALQPHAAAVEAVRILQQM